MLGADNRPFAADVIASKLACPLLVDFAQRIISNLDQDLFLRIEILKALFLVSGKTISGFFGGLIELKGLAEVTGPKSIQPKP